MEIPTLILVNVGGRNASCHEDKRNLVSYYRAFVTEAWNAERQNAFLLIVGGGIAAYKCLNLVRLLRDAGAGVSCVLTKAAEQFVTPLSVAALSESQVHQELFQPSRRSQDGPH